MSKTEKYTVIRGYSNRCGTDELVRRIVRRHLKYARPENAMRRYGSQGVDGYVGRREN